MSEWKFSVISWLLESTLEVHNENFLQQEIMFYSV